KRLQMMVEIAAMAAIAWVLSLYRVGKMPQGGSVSLEMLPIYICALRWGAGPGVASGTILGLLSLMDATIVHPAQMLLDYPLAFGAIGLAGFFRDKPLVGMVGGGLARWFMHVVSGVIFFGSYAPEGSSVVGYSMVYNITYILPEIILAILIAPLVLRRLTTTKAEELTWRHNAIDLLSLLAPLIAMALVVGLRHSYPIINYAALGIWIALAAYHLFLGTKDWGLAKRGLALISIPPALVYLSYLILK
ncbi:MAG: energy-coupled thiamine transporter ThiT, partial [Bacillota bacterium]